MKVFRIVALSLFGATAAVAEIPDIDSSGWATDPRDHGMSPKEHIQAETRAFFADFLDRAGLNTFHHFPGIASAEDRFVVSPNNDNVYSLGGEQDAEVQEDASTGASNQ